MYQWQPGEEEDTLIFGKLMSMQTVGFPMFGEMYFIQNVDGTWNVNKY